MAQFMLLLHESPSDFADLSPEEIQRVVGEYVAWREGLAAEGKLAAGIKLKDEGGKRLTRNGGGVEVVDGPFAEAKEVVGGFFLINAADYDEAVEISKSCPHLVYSGAVEVREVDPIHD